MELATTHRFISNLSSMLDTLSELGLVPLFTRKVFECQGVCPLRLALDEGKPFLFLCLYSVQYPCQNMWLDTKLTTKKMRHLSSPRDTMKSFVFRAWGVSAV